MFDFNQRIATYCNWPYHVDYQPADFADAGFFYLGVGDRVKCFYCNGGLQHWKNDQEPWSEHAKWFPKYVFQISSDGHYSSFISLDVVRNNKAVLNLSNMHV